MSKMQDWKTPIPLSHISANKHEYPIDALPEIIRNAGMVQKKGILVNTMRDELFPFWYALFVHMMFKNLGNLCDSFKS
ncbi:MULTISPECIES: hypothetical protein, partial [Cysteiniphilum]|uniref:hypothetical protein n=1 Tax=Cysteiniphilum TaxID=2056696 RepID=UPI00177F1BB2